jgi:hypothetical protein
MRYLEAFGLFKKKTQEEKNYKFLTVYDKLVYMREHQSDIEYLNKSEIDYIKTKLRGPFKIGLNKIKSDDDPGVHFIRGDYEFDITKYKDEWFILERESVDGMSAWICDQLDGLIQCIKDNW